MFKHDKPHFLVILGVLGASFSAIFVRLADAPSNVLVFYRLLIASVILIPLAVRELVRLKHRPQFRYLWLAAGSGLFLGLHFAAYFESLRLTSIASSVVLVDTEIFFVALAMYVILREKISRIGWLAIGVAFAGVLIIAFTDAGQGGSCPDRRSAGLVRSGLYGRLHHLRQDLPKALVDHALHLGCLCFRNADDPGHSGHSADTAFRIRSD